MIKPKLALIPSSYKGGSPKGTLYSVLPSDGAGDFDFERAGQATRINKDGLIELVDSNVPRLNYPLIDGVVSGCPSLLLEPQRTNYIFPSNGFSSWSLGGVVTRTANYGISPDGTQNSTRADFTNGGIIFKSLNRPQGAYVFSVFAKNIEGGGSVITIRVDVPSTIVAEFDLSNGTIVGNTSDDAKIEDYGNGWYRCILIQNNDEIINAVIGEGTTELDCELFGAMLEQGSYPTSYIPTTSSTATRSAETCNNAGDVNTFNDSEGVLMAEVNFENNDTDKGISISDGTSSNRVLFYLSTNGNLYGYVFNGNGSVPIVNIIDTNFQINSTAKLAIKYKQNDFSFWVNGIEIGTETIGNTFSSGVLDQLSFTSFGTIANPFYGSTKQIQYFDKALTSTDLEELTSWSSFNEMAQDLLYTIL